jgi:hypothetical protein
MVTLTAGVTWWAASPVAADECRAKPAARAATATRLCDDLTEIRLDDERPLTSQTEELAASTARMAQRIGLTGLASARSAMGLTDLGGIAATSGMPALPSSTPAQSGLPSLTKLPDVPDLPDIPGVSNLPVGMTLGTLPDPAKVAGKGVRGQDMPVNEIKDDLIARTLPQVPGTVDGLTSGTRLPDAQDSLKGLTDITDLLPGLGLN